MFDGHLYPAYGDYGANTGPITVVSLDLTAQTIGGTELTAHTEQLWSLRTFGGKLYAPWMDPQGSFDPAQGQLGIATAHNAWTVLSNVTPIPEHIFDVAVTVDGLWLFGSAGTNAYIWRSTDNGATWTTSLTVNGSGDARFYAAIIFGNTILAKFYDDQTSTTKVYRWDGSSWTMGPNPIQATDILGPFTYLGTPFALGMATDKNTGNVVANTPGLIIRSEDAALADTITATLPTNKLYDAKNAAGVFYLLTETLDILRGDDTGAWTAVATLDDATIRSLEVAAGYLYFGTTDSRILRTPIPA